MTKFLLPLSAALLLFPSFASAAPASQAGQSDEDAMVSDGSDGLVREYDFEPDNVDGEKLVPGGVNIQGRIAKDHENMITIRGDFVDKMIMLSFDI